MRARAPYSAAANRAPVGSGAHLADFALEELSESELIDHTISLIRATLGMATPFSLSPAPPPAVVFSNWLPHPTEMLLADEPVPCPPGRAQDLMAWVRGMLSRASDSNHFETVEHHARFKVSDHVADLLRLRSTESIATEIRPQGSAWPEGRSFLATRAKIDAVRIARMRSAFVRQLHAAPLPIPLRGAGEWTRVLDVHERLHNSARALHAIVSTPRRKKEILEAVLGRIIERRLLPRKKAASLVRMAEAVLAAITEDDSEGIDDDRNADILCKFVLQNSWELAAYQRTAEPVPIDPAMTFIEASVGVTPTDAVVLIAMNLLAAWRWIDRWRDANVSEAALTLDPANLLMPRPHGGYSERALIEITDYLRCDAQTDPQAMRESGRGDSKQSRKVVKGALSRFRVAFPTQAQSKLGFSPRHWLAQGT